MSHLLYTEITPTTLLSTYPGKFYRLTNADENHRGLTYKTGLNIDPNPFNPTGECNAGGMYFFHESNINLRNTPVPWELEWLREVTFPEDARIYVEKDKFKADKFILGERETVPVWVYVKSVSIDGHTIQHIPKSMRTEGVCLEAVKQDGCALQHVPCGMKTQKVCLEAVTRDKYSFRYVPDEMKTSEFYMKAVKQHGVYLQCVPDGMKTLEMCLIAVKQDGLSLVYVPYGMKTEEVCLEAVKQHGAALQYVPNEMTTEEMRSEAVKKRGASLRYAPNKMTIEDVTKMCAGDPITISKR